MQTIFEKIIEKLEEEKMSYFLTIANTGDEKLDYAYEQVGDALDKAIEIVKKEAEQYNNGWIPCSERLPENDCYCLVTTSDMESDIREYGYSKGFGWDGFERIIAWQPLPLPYQPNGE